MNNDNALVLPRYMSDGMIVQQNEPITFKGKDRPNNNVTVTFESEVIETTADNQGIWTATFSPREAGGPYTVNVSGTSIAEIKDVYAGEVWLLGGQSNMELPINRTYDEFKDEIDAADYPLIRQFHLEMDPVFNQPKTWLDQGEWKTATQENIQEFSSLGFFYAKKLYETLNVPVGIYHTAVGGTPIEAWMSEETLHELGNYDDELAYWKNSENVEKEIEKDLKVNQEWYADLYENDRGLLCTPKWSEENVDTADWLTMDVPVMFKDTALNEFTGVVWFRKEFEVSPEQLESESFRLRLGSLINGDETYLNGKKVGETGYRYPPRKYRIEREDLKEGTNTLVIRLMIDAANGGFIPTFPYQLECDQETVALEGEWLYKVGYEKEPIAPMLFLHYKPASLFKGMLYPLKEVAFKGALFYQGESNTKDPMGYKELMRRMVNDWRQLFTQDLPFYYVQLANYVDPAVGTDEGNWAELRYEQDRARFLIENSEMVPAYDCGISYELHPHDKKTLAHRLAKIALSRNYDRGEAYENLEIDTVSKSDNALSLVVKGRKGSLALTEQKPEFEALVHNKWLTLSVSDLAEDKLTCALPEGVTTSQVSKFRYAWRNDPAGYVFDRETKLPLLPFTYPL